MKFRKLAAIVSLPLAFAVSGHTPPAPPAQTYMLAMTLSDSGEVIAERPREVRSGAKLTYTFDRFGSGLYKIDLTFAEAGYDSLAMTSRIDATSPTLGTMSIAPDLVLKMGEPVRIEHGNRTPGTRPLRIEFALSPLTK